MCKTKSEGKTVGLSEIGKGLANLARLRIWQGCCEFGKVANLARLRISLASKISLS